MSDRNKRLVSFMFLDVGIVIGVVITLLTSTLELWGPVDYLCISTVTLATVFSFFVLKKELAKEKKEKKGKIDKIREKEKIII